MNTRVEQAGRINQKGGLGIIVLLVIGGLVLAALIHQVSILILPPLLLACVPRGRQGIRLVSQTGALLAVFFLAGVLPYLVIGVLVRGADTPSELLEWLRGLSVYGIWGHWRLRTVPAVAIGLVRNFTGSPYLLGFQPIADLAQRLFPRASWQDEMAIGASVPAQLRLLLVGVHPVVCRGHQQRRREDRSGVDT